MRGAIETMNIHDMTATAKAVGADALLSPGSHQAQVAPDPLGSGSVLAGCPNCLHSMNLTTTRPA